MLERGEVSYSILEEFDLEFVLDNIGKEKPLKMVQRLKDAEIVIVDESLALTKNEDSSATLLRLIDFIRKNNKKLVLMSGGPLDGSEQNRIMTEHLQSNDIAIQEEQIIEFKPTLLTDIQAKDFLKTTDFSEEQAREIIEKLDSVNCPLIIRVLLMIRPPKQNMEWDNELWRNYLSNEITQKLTQFTRHLKLTQQLH